jgi:hypothetical protein
MDWDVIAMILHRPDLGQPVALRSRRLPLKISLAEPELALLSFPHPNGGRSSMVEPRIVVPDVAGSNPVGHPSKVVASQGNSSRKYPELPQKPRFRA